MRHFTLFLFTVLVSIAHAQTSNTPNATQILLPQSGPWYVHAGDDTSYAAPAFDDSNWPTVTFDDDLPSPTGDGNIRWFRKRIALPAGPSPISLLLIGVDGPQEIYVEGHRVSPPARSNLTWLKRHESTYPLRTDANPSVQEVEVAIRSRMTASEFFNYVGFESAAVGTPDAIQTAAAAHQGMRLGEAVFSLAANLVTCCLGLLLITLYLQQRNHREYLWLGLSVLFFSLTTGLPDAEIQGFLPTSIGCFVADPATYFFLAAELEFVYAFISRRPGRRVRLYQALLVAAPMLLEPLVWSNLAPRGSLSGTECIVILPGIIILLAMLIVWWRRGSREAGLLVIPMLLANAATFLVNVEILINLRHPDFAFPSFHAGLVAFTYAPASAVPFVLAVGFLIFRRFGQVSYHQAQTQAELESVRTTQQILIPEALPAIFGFRIESIYQPAQQVGGDFFQILPTDDGGVLAVLGDVSGKGLPAAMNVALLVGTLRTLAENTSDPAEVLAGLNRRLLGRSIGFTTAVAVRIEAGGQATFSIAGHLNPYLNGQELTLEPGLPLGLTSDAAYTNTSFSLVPGDTLTLLTDGVLEARNPRTQELFGFARTLAISTQPAHAIAQAAQAFGQDDDIAVLTLALS